MDGFGVTLAAEREDEGVEGGRVERNIDRLLSEEIGRRTRISSTGVIKSRSSEKRS